ATNPLGVSSATWSAPITGLVTADGFNLGAVPTSAELFVEGDLAPGIGDQSGLGLVDKPGILDNEINATNVVDLSTPASRAGQTVTATLSIDSLQPSGIPLLNGEAFMWCAQPTEGVIGGPGSNCSGPIFGGTGPGTNDDQAVVQVTFGGADKFLAVTGVDQ